MHLCLVCNKPVKDGWIHDSCRKPAGITMPVSNPRSGKRRKRSTIIAEDNQGLENPDDKVKNNPWLGL